MKVERGITLISLIIYVILITFIVAGVSNITVAFYSNINEFKGESDNVVSYTKFNMYFLNDIKRQNAEVTGIGDNYIKLSYTQDGNTKEVQYSLQNGALYRDKVKICDNAQSMTINVNGINVIKITLKIGDYEKPTTYVIEGT